MRSLLKRSLTQTTLATLTLGMSIAVALAVEHGMARFVYHDAASPFRFFFTLIGLLYVDLRVRMVAAICSKCGERWGR